MFERKTCLWLGLSLLVVYLTRCTGQSDLCASRRSCDNCLQTHPDCLWCSFSNSSTIIAMSSVGCFNRTTYDEADCPGDNIEDPPSVVSNIQDRELSNQSVPGVESVQVQPQVVQMKLRPGDPQSFNMSFIALRNTPLDVYFLLDVSASLANTINAIRNNLEAIADSIGSISSAFRIGLGGFIDKDVFPYAGTINYNIYFPEPVETCRQTGGVCDPPIGYEHFLSLTDNITTFQDALNVIMLRANVDAPEGGLDALAQVAACPDIIGWRPDSLKMLFLMTDSDYHIAGDGYLAGLVRPNDGKCHMEEIAGRPGQYEYTFSTVQDYPSIHQLLGILEQQLIVPIFAIQQSGTDNVNLETYQNLATEFQRVQSQAIPLVTSGLGGTVTADTIIDLINRAYTATSQNIQVNIPSVNGYTVSVEVLECRNATDTGCRVQFGDIPTFRVTVELTDCSAGNQTIDLRGAPYTFSTILVEPVCDCECSAPEFHIESSPSCNENGTEVCGACDCNDGRFGDFCECDSPVNDCVEFNGMECGGETRGMCSTCGECMCIPPNFGPEFGCKCDDQTCLPNCTINGVCVCADSPSCECNPPFIGPDCMCNATEACVNTIWNSTTGAATRRCQVIINESAAGMCNKDCSGCDCSVATTGISGLVAIGGLCVPQEAEQLCDYFAPCIACVIGRNPISDCMSACSSHPSYEIIRSGDSVDSDIYFPPCMTTVGNCQYDFYVGRDPFSVPVLVNEGSQDCISLPFWAPYVIAAALVLAIIIIGLCILGILKIAFVEWDKREYKKFTRELQDADFAPHENPLYLTPNQEYRNPLRRHSSKRKQ